MLQQDGNVMTDIFIKDNLHMNPKGYAIWQGIIAPTLMRD
jgi:lysophospholipase L1-like esterase